MKTIEITSWQQINVGNIRKYKKKNFLNGTYYIYWNT